MRDAARPLSTKGGGGGGHERCELFSHEDRPQDELFEVQEEEKKATEEKAAAEQQAEYKKSLVDANIAGVDTLLTDMLEDDPEQSKLQQLSFWFEIIDEMQLEFKQLTNVYIETTVAQDANKVKDRQLFEQVLNESRAKNDAESISLIRKFDAKKKKLQRQLDDMGSDEAVNKLQELDKANVQLTDDLLELQLRQMEADEQIISAFEGRYGNLVQVFVESAQQSYFQKVRDLENSFNEKALTMTQEELDAHAAGSLEDLSEGTKIFLSDRDVVLVSLSTSHDAVFSLSPPPSY